MTSATSPASTRIARGSLLLNHRVFLSVGHDEYWSGQQRANVEAARNAGVNLAFFSGNEMFWKTRWENSIDGSNTTYRTLVNYKETHANAKIDPLHRVDRHLARSALQPAAERRPSGERRHRHRLHGELGHHGHRGARPRKARCACGAARPWRRWAPASRPRSPTAHWATNGIRTSTMVSRPAGLIRLSDTTVSNVDKLQDYGSFVRRGYREPCADHVPALERRAACSAPARSSGRGVWMRLTIAPERRATCACSRRR